MFLLQPPQVRETEVFTRMPEHFRRTGVRSDWADANRGGQPTDSFLEGPVFDAAGNLYVTDIPFGRIFRIDPRGEWEQVAEWAGEPNGMKFLNCGRGRAGHTDRSASTTPTGGRPRRQDHGGDGAPAAVPCAVPAAGSQAARLREHRKASTLVT